MLTTGMAVIIVLLNLKISTYMGIFKKLQSLIKLTLFLFIHNSNEFLPFIFNVNGSNEAPCDLSNYE